MENQKSYLLDTNAYFNFLRYAAPTDQINKPDEANPFIESIEKIKEGVNYISALSQIEIISVIGKYSRGNAGDKQKCDRIVSQDGEICSNYHFVEKRKRWSNEKIKWWLKLIDDTVKGVSPVLNVSVFTIITSDKGLKACLNKCMMPYWDAFKA